MDYQETLQLVEDFMINSGIRNYCTNICKGECCGNCYSHNKEACHKNEGRRLACSIFICGIGNKLFEDYLKSHEIIMKTIKKIYKKYSSSYILYSNIPPKELFFKFKIPKRSITCLKKGLSKAYANTIRNKIDSTLSKIKIEREDIEGLPLSSLLIS